MLCGVLALLPEVASEAPPAEFASDTTHLRTEYRRARDAYNHDGGHLESGIAARAVPSSVAADCPAALLVLPIAEADRGRGVAGESETKAGSDSLEAERLRIANERLGAYEDLTATVRATSLQGGMLSLMMVARWASWITDNDLTTQQSQEAAEKVVRLLYSAQRVFERIPGAAPNPTLRDSYMPDRMDPWGLSTSAGSTSHVA